MFEYKVVEHKAKSLLKGRLKPGDLQLLLNLHADEGWILDRIVDGDSHRSMSIPKHSFFVIFRRPVVVV